jgi:hypothetical protein
MDHQIRRRASARALSLLRPGGGMSWPLCPECGGGFVCAQCDYPLRKLRMFGDDPGDEGGSDPDHSSVLTSPFAFPTEFELGPRGGAIIDFGNLIRLECLLFFVDEETGSVLPWLPMPLDGQVIHDLSRSDRAACGAATCACPRPTGWRLTRPILRVLLGKSDAFLNEHGRQLPGRLPCWCLCVDTVTFMRDAYFERDFQFPTRQASRAARRHELAARREEDPAERLK